MKTILCLSAAATSFLLAGEPPAVTPVSVTKDNVRTFYGEFKRLTDKPKFVPALVAAACASKPLPGDRPPGLGAGPHTGGFIHVYLNPAGVRAAAAQATVFPEGTVVVKEKLRPGEKGAQELAVFEVGGMIKRAKGYDPANGDWEYFYSDDQGGFTTGKLANCRSCHSGAARDYVFKGWTESPKPPVVNPGK